MRRTVKVGDVKVGGGHPLVLIAGPCVIEGRRQCVSTALRLAKMASKLRAPLIFKASYDKANRSSLKSYRGPGLDLGLEILREVRERCGIPVLTDVHSEAEVERAANVADIIQIPAFLCRQTDLLVAAGASGRPVNVKKGQFLAPWDMGNVIAKLASTGNRRILLTERGVSFGYNDLVADMRSLVVLRKFGYPVVFDATHCVQRPGAGGDRTAGDAAFAPYLARAAAAAGCDAIFVETHVNPAKALSDRDTMIPLSSLAALWREVSNIHEIVS